MSPCRHQQSIKKLIYTETKPRIMAYQLIIFLTMLLVSHAQAANLTKNRDPGEFFFHQSFNDLQEEIEIAREKGQKGIFIMFGDKDCPWCQKMKATIMNQKPVQEYFRQHFRVLHIDIRGDTMMVDFQGNEIAEKNFSFKQNRVRATPVFIFFDLNGEVAKRYTGVTRTMIEFIWLGEYVVDDQYKSTNFSQYKRARKAGLQKVKE